MNHGIQYVSICWTFVFVSHCIFPDRCTAEVNAQMHEHCQSTCRLFIQCFFQYFFMGRGPQMYAVGGHLVSIWDYTTIDFWSGLDNPSDLDLANAYAIIPQLTSDPVSHTHQRPRVEELAKRPCHSITYSVYNSQVSRFAYKHIRLMLCLPSLQPCCPHDD